MQCLECKKEHPLQTHKCKICDHIIIGRSKKFCSRRCRDIDRSIRENRITCPVKYMHCVQCGKLFVTKRHHALCCSPKCSCRFYYAHHSSTIIEQRILQQKTKMKLDPEYKKFYLKRLKGYMRNTEHEYKRKVMTALGNRCEICGTDIIEILTIHHTDPKNKRRGNSATKWKRIWQEYQAGAKLRLLCHNHHVLLHARKLNGDIVEMACRTKT